MSNNDSPYDGKSPQMMATFLLEKNQQNVSKAAKEAREMLQNYKVCLNRKVYWCEVVHCLEYDFSA